LERAGLRVRHSGLQALTVLFALAFEGGLYRHSHYLVALAAAAILGAMVLICVAWRLRRASRGERASVRTDATIAFLGTQLAFAVIQSTGGVHSTLYPLLYLLAAFMAVAPWPRSVSIGLVVATAGENALRYACLDVLRTEWAGLVIQTGFLGVFALLYNLLLSIRIWSSRIAEQEAVTLRVREAEDSARRLRLLVTDRSRDAQGPTSEDDLARRLLLGAILEVEKSVGSIMEGAFLALGGHSLALYWLSTDEATINLRDGRSPAGLLAPGPLPAGDGLLGSVLRHSQPLRSSGKISGVNWYDRAVAIRSAAAVPVIELAADGTGYVRGVLVADRLDPIPFEEKDIAFLSEIARQIARAVEVERLVGELHRSKDAQDRLQHAAEQLNRMATVEEVTRSAAKIARDLVPSLDLAAITRVDRSGEAPVHVVAAAEGARGHEVDGLVFDDNDGLVAQAVHVGGPLPPKAPAILERVKVFDLKLRSLGSLRVLPLHAGGQVIGTLVAASGQRHALDGEARRRIESLAVLTAGALARALALHQIAEMATTDGLTGLANRRQLDVLGDRLFREAARYNRPLGAIVIDVDHFKRVNDGHGHAAGDEVLRGLATAIHEQARDADLTARYGGEEFVVILPNTDSEGAARFAERVRKRIAAMDFMTSGGPLRITASFGVAAFPAHAISLADLIAAADAALYEAKSSGRDRVVVTRTSQLRRRAG
jgi:diguanylate cyclase (GGDEF)-like protein